MEIIHEALKWAQIFDFLGIFKYVLGAYIFAGVTWIFFVAGTHLIKVKDNLRTFAKVNAVPYILLALVLDALFNLTVGTVLFIEIPRELLLTSRLKRHKWDTIPNTRLRRWRVKAARWFCDCLLDPFDKGHCDP